MVKSKSTPGTPATVVLPSIMPSEEFAGPYVNIGLYFYGYRHWNYETENGSFPTVEQQYRELEREGISGLYSILWSLVRQHYSHAECLRKINPDNLKGYLYELNLEGEIVLNAWVKGNSHETRYVTPQYGTCYNRTITQKAQVVLVPVEFSESEIRAFGGGWVKGMLKTTIDHKQTVNSTAEQIGMRWVELFIAEVRELTNNDNDNWTPFHSFRKKLTSYVCGSKEGAKAMEKLKGESKGSEVLVAFERIRDQLKIQLDEIANDLPSDTPATEQGQRLTWKGNTMELAELIHVLETQGWIEGGRTRSKLARRVVQLFNRSDGDPIEIATLITYLGIKYPRTPREGVEFNITKNPDKT